MSFICHPEIHQFEKIEAMIQNLCIGQGDCILSNRYTFNAEKFPTPGAQLIWQEDYGVGEPDCEMLSKILRDTASARRIIAIGGGTVLDIAKIMSLDTEGVDIYELFSGLVQPRKKRELVLVPTTCGTGSEVTNVAVVSFPEKSVKLGLAHQALYADHAVLVPEFLKTLPYKPFVYSAIDALVHAVEALLSPKRDSFTLLYSGEAIRRLIEGFLHIAQTHTVPDIEILSSLQLAACQAGLAFGNAGCGTVHAMSYPVGAEFHIAHGEVNYALFTATLRYYCEFDPLPEAVQPLKTLLAGCLNCMEENCIAVLEDLLMRVIPCKRLHEYGMRETQIAAFSALVLERQQRLLRNSPIHMDDAQIQSIYRSVY